MGGRKILLTNIWLTEPSGSEVVVRDLSWGLLRRGHRPIVYAPTLGSMAEVIRKRGVPVFDDLRQLNEKPDIIHAHHSIPCGEALMRFPDVPAIFVCHDFTSWLDAPLHFPQIASYVAVDQACRDRLVHQEGIDPQKVMILHNAVDLSRIPERPAPLNRRPKRALAFGKAAAVPELLSACEQAGLEVHKIGRPVGRLLTEPETELVKYDLVFATARAALEAMCCGCSVIAVDQRGMSGLVTTQNFAELRELNFGLRSLAEAPTVERCLEEISRYDADDAAAVAARARREADLENLLDRFESLREQVLNEWPNTEITAQARQAAETRFLRENLPRKPWGEPRWPWMAERERLMTENDRLIQANEALRAQLLQANETLRLQSVRETQRREARLARRKQRRAMDTDLPSR